MRRAAGPLPTAPMHPRDRVRSRFHRERLLERFLAGEAIDRREP